MNNFKIFCFKNINCENVKKLKPQTTSIQQPYKPVKMIKSYVNITKSNIQPNIVQSAKIIKS